MRMLSAFISGPGQLLNNFRVRLVIYLLSCTLCHMAIVCNDLIYGLLWENRDISEYCKFTFAQTSAYSSVVLEVMEECIGREQ